MNGRGELTRGKPVRAVLVILGAWVLLRVAFWQSPFAVPGLPLAVHTAPDERQAIELSGGRKRTGGSATEMGEVAAENVQLDVVPPPPSNISFMPLPTEISAPPPLVPPPAPIIAPPRRIVGHNLLMMAGLAQMEVAPGLIAYFDGSGPRAPQTPAAPAPAFVPIAAARFARETAPQPRWSMDFWALFRHDDNAALLSSRPSYGRSQIGAVLRFNLAPSSGHAPQVYLRTSAALAGGREEESALGLSARPVPGVPMRLAGEARLQQTGQGRELRGAVFAVSEFPPLPLPGRASGEAYVQGGYVTGQSATGFVDGQARITRDVVSRDRFRLSAGAGLWGGAQAGSQRLDIGPSAIVSVSAGGVNARISADYRLRLAGEARPASGPALTISAGF